MLLVPGRPAGAVRRRGDGAGRAGSRRSRSSRPAPRSQWIWGAFKMPGAVLAELFRLWCERDRRDEYLGTLLNAYIARGGEVRGIPAGQGYVDVGTLDGYRQALRLLDAAQPPAAGARTGGRGVLSMEQAASDLSREAIAQRVRELGTWFHNLDLRRRPDRARPLPRRLPGGQVAALRARAAAGPAGPDRARHRLQRRVLRDRDEAPRRRPGRGRRPRP